MKILRAPTVCAFVAISTTASVAAAEDGLYYGASIGISQYTSDVFDFDATTAETATLGGLLGYRKDMTQGRFWSVEFELDIPVDGEMTYDDGSASCTSVSPDWCNVDAVSRLRAIYGMPVGGGYDAVVGAGLAAASGRSEDGPGNYVDTIGSGWTVAVGLQRGFSSGSIARVEVIYDEISATDNSYEPKLENLSLRGSFLF